jgi:hypothetical protein
MNQFGSITLDLSPGPGNPRNSASSFLELDDNRILFGYSRYIGASRLDDGKACIACCMSEDGGETWSQDQVLFRPEDHCAVNLMCLSFLHMANGDIGLFYLVRKGWHDTRLHIRRSADGGKSWSEAIPCIPALGYYVTNAGRVIRLSSGRILAPSNLHRMKSFDSDDWVSWDSRGIPLLFYSDDDGFTWQEGSSYCLTTLPNSTSGLQESGMIELRRGIVYQWMRTDTGCQYEAYSFDNGDTWTQPVPSRFTGPTSPLTMKRIPADGRLVAVWNPVPNYNGRFLDNIGAGRNPLVLAISANNGHTWSEPIVLEDAEERGFCYPAIAFTPDAILLSYCAGGPDDGDCLSRTVVRKIPLKELP